MRKFKQIIAKEELFNLFRILKLVRKYGGFLTEQLVEEYHQLLRNRMS
ncbi:MAG TPA: hypothetical protein PLM20_02830 [Syntrophomonadaceae bacterium]|nr:hypothetical protein [Syntrophomonadaceae bacterium]